MVLELVTELALSVVDLARMSLIVAVPAFLLVVLGQFLHKKLSEKFELSWILSAFIATFAIMVPIVFALYLIPYSAGLAGASAQKLPEFMQVTAIDTAMAVVSTVVKNLLSAFLFSILLMPLLFFASFADEKLKERFKMPKPANTFAVVFITALVSWLVILLVFPWVVSAIIWKLYWSPI